MYRPGHDRIDRIFSVQFTIGSDPILSVQFAIGSDWIFSLHVTIGSDRIFSVQVTIGSIGYLAYIVREASCVVVLSFSVSPFECVCRSANLETLNRL